jgi:Flp pilus assembly CpaF family ATPase
MLQAMNTGHDGSLTTLHANSTRDTVQRVETMVMMAGSTCRCGPSASSSPRPST